jgi:hypothetical protein
MPNYVTKCVIHVSRDVVAPSWVKGTLLTIPSASKSSKWQVNSSIYTI